MTADEPTVEADVRERIESDPFCATLGIDLVDLGPTSARTELAVGEDLLNFHGTPHGGAVYSLADAAFAAASNAQGKTALALETNISYLDSVDVGATLVATAEETHASGRTAEYEVVVTENVEDRNENREGGNDAARIATFRGRVYRP